MTEEKELSIEQLIELAKQPPTEQEVYEDKLSEVKRFALEKGIKEGNANVPSYQLYFFFVDWHKEKYPHRKKIIDVRQFGKEMTKYFGHLRVKTQAAFCYKIDPTPFDITSNWQLRKRQIEKLKQSKG